MNENVIMWWINYSVFINKLILALQDFQQGMRTKTGSHPTWLFVRAATPFYLRTETTSPPNHTPQPHNPLINPTCIPWSNNGSRAGYLSLLLGMETFLGTKVLNFYFKWSYILANSYHAKEILLFSKKYVSFFFLVIWYLTLLYVLILRAFHTIESLKEVLGGNGFLFCIFIFSPRANPIRSL